MDIKQNYFELFSLPISYHVDQSQLSVVYRNLQRELHPDRFANASEQEQRMSVQYTAFINEAFETLQSQVKRAHYLLVLKGIEDDFEQQTTADSEFLMQQIHLRETLEEISTQEDPESALDALNAEVDAALTKISEKFSIAVDDEEINEAKAQYQRMQFMYKLALEVERVEEDLLDIN